MEGLLTSRKLLSLYGMIRAHIQVEQRYWAVQIVRCLRLAVACLTLDAAIFKQSRTIPRQMNELDTIQVAYTVFQNAE